MDKLAQLYPEIDFLRSLNKSDSQIASKLLQEGKVKGYTLKQLRYVLYSYQPHEQAFFNQILNDNRQLVLEIAHEHNGTVKSTLAKLYPPSSTCINPRKNAWLANGWVSG